MGADIEPVQLRSMHLPDVKEEPGKAPAWQVTFVSARSAKARPYTYSVVESEGNLHKGVFALQEESWSGARGPKPFPMAAVKTDTDAALRDSEEEGGRTTKKRIPTNIMYILEKTDKFPTPPGVSSGASRWAPAISPSWWTPAQATICRRCTR